MLKKKGYVFATHLGASKAASRRGQKPSFFGENVRSRCLAFAGFWLGIRCSCFESAATNHGFPQDVEVQRGTCTSSQTSLRSASPLTFPMAFGHFLE